jgi:hypothetical protein
MPGTLSGNIATAELGSSVGKEVVCTTDGAAVLVEFDHEGYVVCHWPLSYGVFDADGVDEALTVELPLVESVKIGAYDGINQVEGIGPAVVRAAEVEGAVVLEAALSGIVEGDEGTALLEEASATEEVVEFELYGVFDADGVDEALKVELPLVESVKIGVYNGIDQVEGIGPAVVRAAEVAEGAVVLEPALSGIVEGDEGTALLEEASATEEVDELELDSVVTDSGTSIVTVGELTSMIEYPVLVTVAGLGVTVTSTV